MGIRIVSAMIEWRSRLDGLNGLILLQMSYGLMVEAKPEAMHFCLKGYGHHMGGMIRHVNE